MIHMAKVLASSVANASAGFVRFFADSADGRPKYKDEVGAVFGFAGGTKALVVASAAIAATETVVMQDTIPAASLQVGTTFRITLFGRFTQTGLTAVVNNFRIRIGTAGTVADAQVVLLPATSNAAASTNIAHKVEFLVTIRTVGVSGTAIGYGVLSNMGVTGVSASAVVVAPSGAAPAATTVNTTVANTISVTFIAGAATSNAVIEQGSIEIVKV